MPLLTLRSQPVISLLVDQPESGMGFQVISCRLILEAPDEGIFEADGDFMALQSRYLLALNARNRLPLELTTFERFRELVLTGDLPSSAIVLEILELELIEARLGGASISPPRATYLSPQPAPVGDSTKVHESFYRFYAYPNDPRVLRDGGLAPGTNTTTFNDARLAPSGYAAVGRYALPNPLPAKYVHVVTPPRGTDVIYGAVVPNFNNAGGGVEAAFPNGARHIRTGFQLIPDG